MPVEIRELVIRAITAQDRDENDPNPEKSDANIDPEAIVQECVRQVLRILKQKEER